MPTSDEKNRVLTLVNRAHRPAALIKYGIPSGEAAEIIRARSLLPSKKFQSLEQLLNLLQSSRLNRWYDKFLPRCREDRPVLLVPLRLETRVVKDELRLRVYPDEVSLDVHDPRLTTKEVEAGMTYLAEVADATARNDTDAKTDAWRKLSSKYGPLRGDLAPLW